MTIAYLDEIIEDYAHGIFRMREKDFYKSLGKAHGWNELTKVIDYKKLRSDIYFIEPNHFIRNSQKISSHTEFVTVSQHTTHTV